jgi:NAD+ diphosphatase
MLVHDGELCLLGRQQRWPAGMYSTLAGFVEPGETIEEAVAREIMEEAGIAVDDVRYFRSQPWPFPSSLMIGFTARATSREIHLGDDELQDARWVTRQQIRDCRSHGFFVPGPYSLAGQLIEAFLAQET